MDMKTDRENRFTEEEIQAAVREFCSRGIQDVRLDKTFYDPEARKFFRVAVDGSFYHGYDVHYENLPKEQVVSNYRRWYCDAEPCESGSGNKKIPFEMILERLPYEAGPYTPPPNFGEGKLFI